MYIYIYMIITGWSGRWFLFDFVCLFFEMFERWNLDDPNRRASADWCWVMFLLVGGYSALCTLRIIITHELCILIPDTAHKEAWHKKHCFSPENWRSSIHHKVLIWISWITHHNYGMLSQHGLVSWWNCDDFFNRADMACSFCRQHHGWPAFALNMGIPNNG